MVISHVYNIIYGNRIRYQGGGETKIKDVLLHNMRKKQVYTTTSLLFDSEFNAVIRNTVHWRVKYISGLIY